jgi:hypothetical protein
MTDEQAHEILMNAIQRCAEAGREVADTALPSDWNGAWIVGADEMNALREALKGWSAAGNAMIDTIRGKVGR